MTHLNDSQFMDLVKTESENLIFSQEQFEQLEHIKNCENCYKKYCGFLAVNEAMTLGMTDLYIQRNIKKQVKDINRKRCGKTGTANIAARDEK